MEVLETGDLGFPVYEPRLGILLGGKVSSRDLLVSSCRHSAFPKLDFPSKRAVIVASDSFWESYSAVFEGLGAVLCSILVRFVA